jgi:DNA-binding MarR family transcriptional regulator
MSHPTLDLKRAYLALRRALEHTVKPFNFTGAQFDVLQFLLHGDGMEHRELQRKLSVTSPTLTNILDGMVQAGHVVRRADPSDGRVKRLYLGDAARKVVASKKFCDAGDALVDRMFKGFTVKERQEFSRALSRIEANLDGM